MPVAIAITPQTQELLIEGVDFGKKQAVYTGFIPKFRPSSCNAQRQRRGGLEVQLNQMQMAVYRAIAWVIYNTFSLPCDLLRNSPS
jgi:hypothetical protein